ncbi:MAG: MFS transporter [Planctomycetota bacterium]
MKGLLPEGPAVIVPPLARATDNRMRTPLPRTVFALGAVSFFTDLSSEMIVPLLPVFMTGLGASMVYIGLLQGLSELVVAALKLASGWLSDRQQHRKPWLLFGYGLSTLMRPLFALVQTPLQAVLVRSGDRVGKGLRSAPRDALIVDCVPKDRRGEAFGVQRAMDHAGALGGALAGSALLAIGCEMRMVFALALVPGLFAVLTLVFGVRESAAENGAVVATVSKPEHVVRRLAPFLAVVVLAAVGSAVDLFALARASELGVPIAGLPLLWAVLHVARAGLSRPLGTLSDRLGRVPVIAYGLSVHIVVMLGFATVEHSGWLWPLFAVHGLHAAFTEGAERGYVADLTGAGKRGRVFGVYHAAQGVALFAGPLLLGLVWDRHGAGAAFAVAAGASLLALLLLPIVVRSQRLRG